MEIRMQHHNFGRLAKEFMAAEDKEAFTRNPEKNKNLAHLADAVRKAAYSTAERYDGAFDFGMEGYLYLDKLSRSVMDAVSGFRLAPVETNLLVMEGDPHGIVPEGFSIKVSGRGHLARMTYQKTGSIRIYSKEVARSPSGNAESFFNRNIRSDTEGSSNKSFFEALLSFAAFGGEYPASGTDPVSFLVDLQASIAQLALRTSSSLVLVVDLETCVRLAYMVGDSGERIYPDLNPVTGGEVCGVRIFPVNSDELVIDDVDSSEPIGGALLIDVDGLLLDRGQIYLDRSDDGTVELETDPAMAAMPPTDAEGALISLFQADAVALRAVRTFAVRPIRKCFVKITGTDTWGKRLG